MRARYGLRWLLVVVALAVLGGRAEAQQPRIDGADLIEFGLYESKRTGDKPDAGTPSGSTHIVAEVAFYEATNRVPARLGTRFGIRYRIVGEPAGAQVPIRVVWRLPAPGLRNPTSGNVYRESVSDFAVPIGQAWMRGYGFDSNWELVPGDWTLELWSGARKLLTKTFTVYKP
jgi:hypothetical protein